MKDTTKKKIVEITNHKVAIAMNEFISEDAKLKSMAVLDDHLNQLMVDDYKEKKINESLTKKPHQYVDFENL